MFNFVSDSGKFGPTAIIVAGAPLTAIVVGDGMIGDSTNNSDALLLCWPRIEHSGILAFR